MKTKLLLSALILAPASAAVATVLSISGGDFFSPASGIVAGGSLVTAAAFSHSYTLGGSAKSMSGGGYSLTPGTVGAARPAALDLAAAHAFPTLFKPSLGHNKITFTALTPRATVEVYTLSGRLVRRFEKADSSDKIVWTPVVNDLGQPLASGVYLISIFEDGIPSKKGKFMVIR